jgi:hypothetical protein
MCDALENDCYLDALGSYDRVFTQVAKSTHHQPRFGGEKHLSNGMQVSPIWCGSLALRTFGFSSTIF